MEQERAGEQTISYIQEFNIGKINQRNQIITRLENTRRPQYPYKYEVNFITQAYTTSCDISRINGRLLAKGRIYQAKLEQKQLRLSLFEVANDYTNATVLKSEQIFESKVHFANQGVWFTVLNDVLSLVAVDIFGVVTIISLGDEQTIKQCHIQGVDILWSVSAIEYFAQSKENLCFLACVNEGLLFYFNQPLIDISEHIYPQQQASLRGILGRFSSPNPKYDPLHYCAQITDFVYLIIHDGLKIVTITDSMTISKANSLGGTSVISKERETYRFYQSGFSCDQINNGTTHRGSLLMWDNFRLRVINIDFVKRNSLRQVFNLEDGGEFSFNDALYFQVQEIANLQEINNVVKLNDQVLISRNGQHTKIYKCNQAGISEVMVTETHNYGSDLLHLTNYGIVFAIYQMELFALTLIEHPFMSLVVTFQLMTENMLSQIKSLQQASCQQAVEYCIQKIQIEEMDQIFNTFQPYNLPLNEQLLLTNILVQNQGFQNGVIDSLIQTNSIKSFQEQFIDLVDDHQGILVYLRQNLRLRLIGLQESLDKVVQDLELLLSNDNEHISYDAQRLGNHSQVFMGFEANCRLIFDSAINLLLSHLVLLIEQDLNWSIYENLLRRLFAIKAFLNEQDALILLIKNTRSQIQKYNINYFEISNSEYENLCLSSIKILHRDFDSCPFIVYYMNMIAPNDSCIARIAELLQTSNPNLIYHQAVAYSKLNRQYDCKKTIFKLAKLVNQLDSVDFEQGAWADDKQGIRTMVRSGRGFSNEQELIRLLLRNNELYRIDLNISKEITQVIIGLSYFTPDAESEFQRSIFPDIFRAALRSDLVDLSVELLLISSRLLAHSRSKHRQIMESFIDQYCVQYSIINLINLPLDMRVVYEIYPYIQKWNRRFFDNINQFYDSVVRHQNEKGDLAQRCRIFVQQNNFLYKRNLTSYANEILKSYIDFLDDLQIKDSDTQVLYDQIIAEKLNILALIIQQMNQHKTNSPFDGIYIGDLNIGQDENEDIDYKNPIDLAEDLIQNYRITNVMYQILQVYNIRIKQREDIELVLLAQQNYPLVIEYWKSGFGLELQRGIQMLIEDSYDDRSTCKLLRILLTAPEFQQQHEEIIETIVGSLCQNDKLELVEELKLGPEIFKFAYVALQYNKEVNPQYLIQALNDLILLRNRRQFEESGDAVYVDERCLATLSLSYRGIKEILKSPGFLTENV